MDNCLVSPIRMINQIREISPQTNTMDVMSPINSMMKPIIPLNRIAPAAAIKIRSSIHFFFLIARRKSCPWFLSGNNN